MILGLSVDTFVIVHVVISLVAIVTGIVAMVGLASGRWLPGWQIVFLVTTALTSLSGFLFPFSGATPAFAFGVISTIALGIVVAALPRREQSLASGVVYVIAAILALYLNVFVLVVQSFLKIGALQSLAPTQSEPAFVIGQAIVLVGALIVGGLAVRSTRFLHAD